MGSTKQEQLQSVLKELDGSPGMEGSAVITRDGLVIVSDLDKNIHADTFAAMSATMLGSAEAAMQQKGQDIVTRVIAEAKDSRLVALPCFEDSLLVSFVQSNADMESIRQLLQKFVDNAGRIVKGP